MKKVTTKIRLILPLIIFVISLSACGGKDTSRSTVQQETTATTAIAYGNNTANGPAGLETVAKVLLLFNQLTD